MVNGDRFSKGIEESLSPVLQKVLHPCDCLCMQLASTAVVAWVCKPHDPGFKFLLLPVIACSTDDCSYGNQMGDKESLGEFKKLFDGAQFRNGLELSFSSTPEGALAARIDDKEVRAQSGLRDP